MKQFVRFLSVGVLNTVVGYAIIFGCMYLANMSPESSNVIGYTICLLLSYILNKKYTFQSQQKKRGEILRFFIVFIIAYTANFLMLVFLIHQADLHKGLSQIFASGAYVLISYIMNKYYVFKG